MWKSKDKEVKGYLDHFNPELSPALMDYLRDEVFLSSRYIFTQRAGKRRYGYCTHCNQEFLIPQTPAPYLNLDFHSSKVCRQFGGQRSTRQMRCPLCDSVCWVKASGRKRGNMYDKAYVVYYEKSVKNPQAIVARGVWAVRDYRSDYKNVETKCSQEALYIFEPGASTMLKSYYQSVRDRRTKSGYRGSLVFEKRKKVFSLYKDQWNPILSGCQLFPGNVVVPCFVSEESISKAVKDTPFQYFAWDSYFDDDRTEFFALATKYPCVEYLTKMGFDDLIREKLAGFTTYRTINWRGKTMQEVLMLNKQEIREIRANNITLSFHFLAFYRTCKKNTGSLSIAEAEAFYRSYGHLGSYYYEIFLSLLECAPIRKVDKYIKKQAQNEHLKSIQNTLIAWRDYKGDCIKLGWDINDVNIMFPRDLYAAHQNTIEQVKYADNEQLSKGFALLADKLAKDYFFEYENLFIRPAQSTIELVREGQALHHCVGTCTYTKRYSRGETILLIIREKSAPDKPYYTVEIQKNTVIQCRGKNNCAPDARINKFMRAFKAAKLQGKQNKKGITIPA